MSKRSDLLLGAPERRAVAVDEFELRQAGDNLRLSGYASVFETGYDVFGGPPRGWTETVDRRAFDKTLTANPDVHLLINHEGMPLARTKSGTMRLSTDTRGLLVDAELDRRDPDVQALEVKMGRGDMDQMSFAFRTIRDSWNDDDTERRLVEVSIDRGDVSVVNFGANPATSSQLRSLIRDLSEIDDVESALAEVRSVDHDVLNQAYKLLGRLVRESAPAGKRAMSVAEALAVIDG